MACGAARRWKEEAMKVLIFVAAALVGVATSAAGSSADETHWRETQWNGERAYVATGGAYEAVVSVDRARLIFFGRSGSDNLLYVPPDLSNPAEWGGHRVWLGPQSEWSRNWPPPAAWEASAAEKVTIEGARLELLMPSTGDEWPRLRRVYWWDGDKLRCAARIDGGRRPAQIIHVVQVLAHAEVSVRAEPSNEEPRGYVQLHLGRGDHPIRTFPEPPHVRAEGSELTLRHVGKMEKLGFRQQPLTARMGAETIRVEAGVSSGRVDSTPDDGFVTQVYLSGARAPLIELEQLSPLFARDQQAAFEIVIAPVVAEKGD